MGHPNSPAVAPSPASFDTELALPRRAVDPGPLEALATEVVDVLIHMNTWRHSAVLLNGLPLHAKVLIRSWPERLPMLDVADRVHIILDLLRTW